MIDDAIVIVPQFGRSELTLRCLASLRRQHPSLPIVVIDDGSPLADVRAVQRAEAPGVTVIRQSHQGTTAAWNRALRATMSRWLVFLNNDVDVGRPVAAELIGPLVRGEADMVGSEWRVEGHVPRRLRSGLRTDCFLSGWCFAIARQRLLDLGGFDDRLMLYFSDTDLQLRLIREAGGDRRITVALPGLRHTGCGTTRSLQDQRLQWQRDRCRFLRKWAETGEEAIDTGVAGPEVV